MPIFLKFLKLKRKKSQKVASAVAVAQRWKMVLSARIAEQNFNDLRIKYFQYKNPPDFSGGFLYFFHFEKQYGIMKKITNKI